MRHRRTSAFWVVVLVFLFRYQVRRWKLQARRRRFPPRLFRDVDGHREQPRALVVDAILHALDFVVLSPTTKAEEEEAIVSQQMATRKRPHVCQVREGEERL